MLGSNGMLQIKVLDPLPGTFKIRHAVFADMKALSLLLFLSFGLWQPVLGAEPETPSTTNAPSASPETMPPKLFREIISMAGDNAPLLPQLASVPLWTNSVASNVMTYTSGKVFREEITVNARTVRGKYVVFTAQSKLYGQPMESILAYDQKVAALKIYGLYGDGRGGDIVTEGTTTYNYTKKTYTITSSYGDNFKETTNGSYTDTEDLAKSEVYKDGVLVMKREVITRPVPRAK